MHTEHLLLKIHLYSLESTRLLPLKSHEVLSSRRF